LRAAAFGVDELAVDVKAECGVHGGGLQRTGDWAGAVDQMLRCSGVQVFSC
jgi:hypothetical protein